MARFLKDRSKTKGAAPGSLIFIGRQKMKMPKVRLFSFNIEGYTEKAYSSIEEALKDVQPDRTNWINIDGLHDTSVFQSIGTHFKISSLALENVLNTGQRAKFFENTTSLTLLTKAVSYDPETTNMSVEQISFILLENVLISIQERPGDHFEPVRERIRNKIGRVRKSKADYLLFSLCDCLVDNYLINIEQLGVKIEELETRLSQPEKEISDLLFHYKNEIHFFRKTIRPLKDAMARFLISESEFIRSDSKVYFRELSDLVEHAVEAADSYATMISDQWNVYNTNLSNRANEVMKVLTIFASIFIPLTFIAGIYGTNFDYVPELKYRYSYFAMWGVMLLMAGGMLVYFKKNKWF